MRASQSCLVVLLLWSGTASAADSDDANVLSLPQAVREALTHNVQMLNARDGIEQAGLGVKLAQSAFRPKVVPNVQGSLGTTDATNQNYRLDVLQRFSTGTEVRAGFGTNTLQIPSTVPGEGDIHFYNADSTLTLSQPLLKGFGAGVGRRALTSAELRSTDASRELAMTEQNVVIDTARAYYAVVAQKALVDVARTGLNRARRLRESSEAKLDAGLVSQLDVLRSQQLVAQAELQLFDSEGAVEDAFDQLRFIMGRDLAPSFDVESEIPNAVETLPLDEAVATALGHRADLARSVAAAADAERTIAYTRNALLPQVDVNLSLIRRQTADSLRSSFGVDRFQFATFLAVSMPIDRTPALVEYQNALIDRDRRRREAETLRRRLADDVRRAVRQLDRVARGAAAAEESVSLGEREVEVAQLRYERGLSNNLDVVTAEANLLAIRGRRISARAELAVAGLVLRATMGTLDPMKDLGDATVRDVAR